MHEIKTLANMLVRNLDADIERLRDAAASAATQDLVPLAEAAQAVMHRLSTLLGDVTDGLAVHDESRPACRAFERLGAVSQTTGALALLIEHGVEDFKEFALFSGPQADTFDPEDL